MRTHCARSSHAALAIRNRLTAKAAGTGVESSTSAGANHIAAVEEFSAKLAAGCRSSTDTTK